MKHWKLKYRDKWTRGNWATCEWIAPDYTDRLDAIAWWGLDNADVDDYELTCEEQ